MLNSLSEFISREMKSLLVIDPNQERCNSILGSIAAEDVQATTVNSSKAALQMLRERRIDCVVLSPEISDLADELEVLHAGLEEPYQRLPVIVYGDTNPLGEGGGWKRLAENCTLRWARSHERLLDLSTFFLHRKVAKLPEAKRQILHDLHQSDKILQGKKVLIVDDDMRNIFALSTVLEEHDMLIVSADNGRDAINILEDDSAVDIVLMDIMMPEMDGMETMRAIRKIPRLKNLPIVAVTAKAMKGDREKCIEAGAWDYLSKPVDTQQMLAVLQGWLHR